MAVTPEPMLMMLPPSPRCADAAGATRSKPSTLMSNILWPPMRRSTFAQQPRPTGETPSIANSEPMTNTTIEETKAMQAGVEAVIYGLPLVMMDLTEKRNINVKRPHGIAAPINQFGHAPIFPPASFKDVVRANVDTLYSSAFLDLSSEPQVLSVPDTGGRYYLLPMLDAWTNVFATPGARTTGTMAANFVITGPTWN